MAGDGRKKDNERHLLAQIKELQRQLDQERAEQAKPSQAGNEQRTRVIVVANRLPITVRRAKEGSGWSLERSSGGLVSAFLGVRNMDITWVGWPGMAVPAEEQEAVRAELRKTEHMPFECVPVFLDETTAELFYNGFCNNVLWPLLHYIPLSMLEGQAQVAEEQWRGYKAANEAFADEVLALTRSIEKDRPADSPQPLVWVQDYHLMLLPRMLREAQDDLQVGWFLHTPFATSEMYRTLPHREEILRGVLGADLIGFHIYDYARHFHSACLRVLGSGGSEGVTEGNEGLFDHAARRSIAVDAFPIGIDPERFRQCLLQGTVKDKVIDLQRRFDGKKVLLGIDRLDYVKGIPHKLKAVEKFLQMYPSMANKIVLVQIAVPSRVDVPGYQKLRSNVHRLVTRINGEFGSLEDVPIHYLDQHMGFEELCALYFRADIMFVTSLRDGMNLVSFEFIACQEKNRGVLVLSEFAGAAQALGAGALFVNPYNTDEVAKALWEALNMKEDKRNERFSYMFDHINGHSAQAWADKFVSGLRHAAEAGEGAYDVGLFSGLEEARQLPKADVVASYKACERNGSQRLIVLGLLGTLIEYASFRSLQQLLPSVRRNLATLASSALNTVVVCSGRERALVNEWLGDLPIWLIAENGLYFRKGGADGTKDWESTKEDVTSDPDANAWMESLKPVFKYFEERTPDTFTEVQEHTITWHFSDATELDESDDDESDDEQEEERNFAEVQAGDLQAHLVKVSNTAPVEVSLDMRRVEVRPYGVSKGAALTLILERLFGRQATRRALEAGEEDDEMGSAYDSKDSRRVSALFSPSREGSVSAGGSSNDLRRSGEYAVEAAAAALAAKKLDAAHRTCSAGSALSAKGEPSNTGSPRPSNIGTEFTDATDVPPLRLSELGFVLCMGEVMARDEDVFTTLMALVGQDEGDEATTDGESVGGPSPPPPMTPPPPATPRSVFTCCVGKTLSQAEFQLHSAHETAGLLDLLAHASLDLPTLGDQASPTAPQLPSVLERLPQLAKRLVGRQLLFVLDYDGCDDEGSSTNLARFLSLYPVARVLREADEGGGDDDGADGAAAGRRVRAARRARAASGSSARRSRCGRRTSCRTARRSRGSGRRARASRGSWRSRSRRCTGRRSRRAWRSCARGWAASTAWRSRTMRSPCRWGTAARRRRRWRSRAAASTRRCASCRCSGASTAATRTRSVPTRSGTSRRSSSTWWAPSSSRSASRTRWWSTWVRTTSSFGTWPTTTWAASRFW